MKKRFIYKPLSQLVLGFEWNGEVPIRLCLIDHSLKAAFSSASKNPHQAGLAYNSCATTVDPIVHFHRDLQKIETT